MKVFVALLPDESCETTLLKSVLMNACACASDLPRRRSATYGVRMSHLAIPAVNGFGISTPTPGLTRSLQVLMCFGLPSRSPKTTTEFQTTPL